MRPGFFTPEFLTELPSDNTKAVVALCIEFQRLSGAVVNTPSNQYHDDFIEVMGLMKAFVQSREIGIGYPWPAIDSDRNKNVAVIGNFFNIVFDKHSATLNHRHSIDLLNAKADEYSLLFEKVPLYEFSDQDFARVQVLLNELRSLIQESQLIPPHHKRRLLRRLEAMQQELHKRTSDIDRFWGFIGEAGIVMRKFGEDLKPVSERVTELGKIVIAVIGAAEGVKALPDVVKLLEHLK